MAPKVWGIGLPRTGTTSLATALRLLGYRKVFHNPIFADLSSADAASDIGCAVHFKYLWHRYPDSKFILTTRDAIRWLPSIEYFFEKCVNIATPVDKRVTHPFYDEFLMRRSLMFDSRIFDPVKVLADYDRHNAEVRRFFADKPGQLLELNICTGDGWSKLCPFLGLKIPVIDFPCSHSLVRPK